MLSKVKKELKLLLLKDDFLVMSLSVYLGFVLQNFLESLVKHFIFPLLNSVVPVNLEDVSFKINNVHINFSEIIQKFINLVIGLVLSYVIIRIIMKHLN